MCSARNMAALPLGSEPLRTIRLSPYRKDAGPSFTLRTWTTGRFDERGQSEIGFRLTQSKYVTRWDDCPAMTILEGAEFYGSPMCADDSDDTMRALCSFLTHRETALACGCTSVVNDFLEQHSEAFDMAVQSRFGEDC